MQPERVVRTMADLRKALADLEREGWTIVNVGGRKALLIPLDPTDDLTDAQFEDLLSQPAVKTRLDKAVAEADAGPGIPDHELQRERRQRLLSGARLLIQILDGCARSTWPAGRWTTDVVTDHGRKLLPCIRAP